ncbi:hypothetical protein TNCV_3489041 [Trichonephila clavipes]|nr:hypothetical protein TNCV_3489041 [Trichonephila clavipes]
MTGGYGQRNGKMCLLTNPASACNITMVGLELGNTVRGEAAELLRFVSPHWSGTWYHGLGGHLSTHCRYTLVRIAGTL